MLRVESVIGSRADPDLYERLHHLEHEGAIEFVTVRPDDVSRHRLLARTDRGEEVAIALPRQQMLYDGAVLVLDERRAVIVRTSEQNWLRLSPLTAGDALELGYLAGNLHWRVRFHDGDLLVALDGPTAAYLARVDALIAAGKVRVL
jgi:urease accessory protein